MKKIVFSTIFMFIAVLMFSQAPHLIVGCLYYNDGTPMQDIGISFSADNPFLMGPYYYHCPGYADTATGSYYNTSDGTISIQLSVLPVSFSGQTIHVTIIDNITGEHYQDNIVRSAGAMTEIGTVIAPYPPPGAPQPPANLTIYMFSDSASLFWDRDYYASRYKVYGSDTPYDGYTLYAEVEETQCEVTGINTSGMQYFYVTTVIDSE